MKRGEKIGQEEAMHACARETGINPKKHKSRDREKMHNKRI